MEDNTITTAKSKRDYFITLDGLLLVGGEDKSSERQLKVKNLQSCAWDLIFIWDECWPVFQDAAVECQEKHKGANAALYGQLGYIMLTVVAGPLFGVYGMRLDPSFCMETIIQPFDVSEYQSRICLQFCCRLDPLIHADQERTREG